MKAITLIQPWASWIALGWKSIETRRHRLFASLVGTRIAIHAGKKWDVAWFARASAYLTAEQTYRTEDLRRGGPRGAIVCTASVTDFRRVQQIDSPAAMCNCRHGTLYGLLLADIHVLREPMPARGRLGVWDWCGDAAMAALPAKKAQAAESGPGPCTATARRGGA